MYVFLFKNIYNSIYKFKFIKYTKYIFMVIFIF